MMKILAAVAAVVGITLIAGTNAPLALGLGLFALASYIVVTRIVEHLERMGHAVDDIRHHAEAERLRELARREGVGSEPAARENESSGSA